MKKSFKCICGTHLLKIHYSNTIEWTNMKTKKKTKENTPDLWIGIYDIINTDTGKKYKKPKLVADFEFMGSDNWEKEMDLGMKFLEDIVTAYIIREK